jgi:hypothetical protein
VRETFSEDEPDCLVCCERPKNVVLLPCRHTCCCSVCLARFCFCFCVFSSVLKSVFFFQGLTSVQFVELQWKVLSGLIVAVNFRPA